jgi:thiamine-phosphate pyrophosphorylase
MTLPRSRNRPIICYVSDRRALDSTGSASASNTLLPWIQNAARAGVDWIQLREKDLDAQALYALSAEALAACSQAAPDAGPRSRLLINDRLDVAWSVHAGGVHLGENSLPVREVTAWKERTGTRDFLVGASCHSLQAALQAESSGADYIVFGPVYETPSKKAFGAPQGLSKLSKVCESVAIPVLAIGGISSQNARECLAAGAAGIAAIRLFQQQPSRVAEELSRIRA